MWLCPCGFEKIEMCSISDVSTDSASYAWESQGEEQEEDDQDVDLPFQETHAFASQQLDARSECSSETSPQNSSEKKRTALRSTAKTWQPLQAWSQRFDKQVADIKAKVEVAMLCSSCDTDVHIQKESNGYTFYVTLAAQDAERFGDDVLAEAQEALLTASEQSTCVCVMGKEQHPFQALEKGFVSTLAEMQDEATACWDMYTRGTCPHGCACDRQHPRSIAYIVVQLFARQ
jgi:hypothetical protein